MFCPCYWKRRFNEFDSTVSTDSTDCPLEKLRLLVRWLIKINRKNTWYHCNFYLFIIHFPGLEAHIHFHLYTKSFSLLCIIRLRIFIFPETFKNAKWVCLVNFIDLKASRYLQNNAVTQQLILLSNRKIPWKSCATLSYIYLSTYDSPAPSRCFIQLFRGIKQGRRQRQRQRQKTIIWLANDEK